MKYDMISSELLIRGPYAILLRSTEGENETLGRDINGNPDRVLIAKAGYSGRQAYGRRPALLIIDVVKTFLGSTCQPVLKSVEKHPSSCGEAGWIALPNIRKLLETCRASNIPGIYTIGDDLARRFSHGPVKRAKPNINIDPKAQQIPNSIAP